MPEESKFRIQEYVRGVFRVQQLIESEKTETKVVWLMFLRDYKVKKKYWCSLDKNGFETNLFSNNPIEFNTLEDAKQFIKDLKDYPKYYDYE